MPPFFNYLFFRKNTIAKPEIIARIKMNIYEPMTDNIFLIPLIIFIKDTSQFSCQEINEKLNRVEKPVLSLF